MSSTFFIAAYLVRNAPGAVTCRFVFDKYRTRWLVRYDGQSIEELGFDEHYFAAEEIVLSKALKQHGPTFLVRRLKSDR